jgi:hypothetical protein
MLPAAPRRPGVQKLINEKQYFVLHSPRHSGKMTTMMAVVDRINKEGSYYALLCSLEELFTINDESTAMIRVVISLLRGLRYSEPEALNRLTLEGFCDSLRATPGFYSSPVRIALKTLCATLDKDLTIFFIATDYLLLKPRLSFLSQIRDGYLERDNTPFPAP